MAVSMNPDKGALLVVDDDEMNREMLTRRLIRKGYAVDMAEDGLQALKRIAEVRFDLVLLDIVMPGINGVEVLKVIRQSHSPTDLPVIMATGRDQSADVVEALNLGANDYVTKPLDLPVVLARVETQLSLKRAVDRITRLEQNLARRNEELEAANGQLAMANERMSHDLEAAAKIQQALLPTRLPDSAAARFAWVFKPCTELAGDLLDVFRLDDQHVALYILDVVGHGVGAALLAVTVHRLLAPTPEGSSILLDGRRIVPPAEVAGKLSRRFVWDNETSQYFTLLYAVLNLQTRVLRFVSAGHPGPIYLPGAAEATMIAAAGFPVGLGEFDYEEQAIELRPGDRMYFYSDGITETYDAGQKQFGTTRFMNVVAENKGRPLKQSLAALLSGAEAWSGAVGLHDDVSLLALEIGNGEP